MAVEQAQLTPPWLQQWCDLVALTSLEELSQLRPLAARFVNAWRPPLQHGNTDEKAKQGTELSRRAGWYTMVLELDVQYCSKGCHQTCPTTHMPARPSTHPTQIPVHPQCPCLSS